MGLSATKKIALTTGLNCTRFHLVHWPFAVHFFPPNCTQTHVVTYINFCLCRFLQARIVGKLVYIIHLVYLVCEIISGYDKVCPLLAVNNNL